MRRTIAQGIVRVKPVPKMIQATMDLGKTQGLALLVSLAVFTCSSLAWAGPPGFSMGPPPVVEVEVVKLQDVSPIEEYVGHVEAIEEVDIRARVEGVIEHIGFKEGDLVKKGQILYVLEQAPYEAKVALAEAEVAQARASLERAQKRLHRLQSARPESIRGTDMDDAMADVSWAMAKLEANRAQLQLARINLDYTIIKSPISGRIGKTAYTKGNVVNFSSGPLATIVKMDPVRVVFSVSETRFSDLIAAVKRSGGLRPNKAGAIRLRLADGKDYDAAGTLDFVDNKVEASTGTIAVRALFPNRQGVLIPGQYVTVLWHTRRAKEMMVVSQRAVQEDQRGRYVLVIDAQNKVNVRRIKTGPVVGTKWAVEQGLSPGEKVIVEGTHKVRPGQVVRPVLWSEAGEDGT